MAKGVRKKPYRNPDIIPSSKGKDFPVEHDAWTNMLTRVRNHTTPRAERWAGRGITVCKRWENSFDVFLEDMGTRPPDKSSLGRINNNDGYWCGHPDCPECSACNRQKNCRWEDAEQQGNNQERTIFIEWNGERRCLKEWAKVTGISYICLWERYRDGLSPEEILGQPSGARLKGRRPNRAIKIEHDGKNLTLAEWSDLTGINQKTLSSRYHWGWPPERIVTEPVKPGRRAGRDYSQDQKKEP